MSQPYGLGAGVVPPPAPPPAGPPQWYPSAPPPPGPPRRRRTGAVLGVAAAVVVVALGAGAVGSVITSSREPAAPSSVEASAQPAQVSPETAMCDTLKVEYPRVVAAINDRNQYTKTPWTDPAIVASSENLARVTWSAADRVESTLVPALPERYKEPGIEYTAGLRALSISHRDRARDMQLNGVASFYNSVVDPVLAVCGIKG